MSKDKSVKMGGGCYDLLARCPWIPDEHCVSCHDSDEGSELEHDGKVYVVCCIVEEHYLEHSHD